MKQVKSSKSLLANVLDMEDDFRLPQSHHNQSHPSHALPPCLVHPPLPPAPFMPPPPPPIYSMHLEGVPVNLAGPPSVGGGSPTTPEFSPGVYRELSLILKEIRVITDKIRDDEDTAAIENDWKFAAMVLDRLCLVTFTLFTIIATIALLLAAPHIVVN